MRIAIYARVSTQDREQNPETQLQPLREFASAQGWIVAGEFVDRASATDLRGRIAWRALMIQASRRKLDRIVVWKLDRAFRSVAHMATTVDQLRRWGVGLRSYSEPWLDTSGTSPVADLMLNILASFAQFEHGLIAERVKAGMERARRQGKHVGRPRKVNSDWETVKALIVSGQLSQGGAARKLGVSRSTVRRAMKAAADEGQGKEGHEYRTHQTSLPEDLGEAS